jgi:glycerol uptake facilitator-like aquaporin
VIGSGIMGERLAGGNVAIALLANTIATGAALVALILTFGPISGAHLNPAVTVADAIEHGIRLARKQSAYIGVQCAGGVAGSDHRASDVWAALVFCLDPFSTRMVVSPQRIRGYVRTAVGHLGMFATTLWGGAFRRCELHHRRLLVHCFNLVCKPSSNHCPFPL